MGAVLCFTNLATYSIHGVHVRISIHVAASLRVVTVLSISGQLLNSRSVNLREHAVSHFSMVDALGGSPSPTPSQLPFQVQIDYSAPDGSRYLKVITRAQPVTTKKVEAESGEDLATV